MTLALWSHDEVKYSDLNTSPAIPLTSLITKTDTQWLTGGKPAQCEDADNSPSHPPGGRKQNPRDSSCRSESHEAGGQGERPHCLYCPVFKKETYYITFLFSKMNLFFWNFKIRQMSFLKSPKIIECSCPPPSPHSFHMPETITTNSLDVHANFCIQNTNIMTNAIIP